MSANWGDNTAGGQDVVGNFSMDFNFATPASSTGSITNFDLRDYDLGVVDLTAGSTGLNVFTGETGAGKDCRNSATICS